MGNYFCTIIIPLYNRSKLVANALKSIMSYSKPYLEKINILELSGKLIHQIKINTINNKDYIPIDLSFLKKGMYFIEIYSYINKTIIEKVIIN